MSIEARSRLMPDWFTRVRTNQLALPRFQRWEAWDAGNVSQMFNTILRDLPIGAVLVLEIGDEVPFVARALEGAPTKGERTTEHLLDGQQRLTALWRGLRNNYIDRTFYVFFETDDETGMPVYVDSIARWKKDGDAEFRPFWANSSAALWKRRMIPLDLFAPELESQKRFQDWSKEVIKNEEERDAISLEVSTIRQKFASFNLPFMSLPVTTKKGTALDVFIKMNTSAAPLSMYDIVVAQVEAALGKSLHDLVGDIRRTASAIDHYYAPEDLALYTSALLQERAPTNATYMSSTFAVKLVDNWDLVLKGATRALEFLEEERIFDNKRLPSDVVIPVLVALFGLAPDALDAAGHARNILRKYLWRAFFSNRYEKSTGSRSLADFLQLRPLVEGGSTELGDPDIFDDAKHPLPQVEELLEAGWPVSKERLARAVLALALRHGGRDLADGSTLTRANLAKREYHHLFPHAHLARMEVPDKQVFVSLNCALVTWQTNRNISDKTPERYLAERRDKSQLGDIEVRARLASHLIPFDEMVSMDYAAFLHKRAALLHPAMKAICTTGAS
jgi:hypothetical protein